MLKDELRQRYGLTGSEIRVVEQVVKGLSNREAGKVLFVTEKTIKFHLTNLYKKMGIISRTQLIVWAIPYMNHEPIPPIEVPAGDLLPTGQL